MKIRCQFRVWDQEMSALNRNSTEKIPNSLSTTSSTSFASLSALRSNSSSAMNVVVSPWPRKSIAYTRHSTDADKWVLS